MHQDIAFFWSQIILCVNTIRGRNIVDEDHDVMLNNILKI